MESLDEDAPEPPFATMYQRPFLLAQKLITRPELIRDVPFRSDTVTLGKLLSAGDEASALGNLVENCS